MITDIADFLFPNDPSLLRKAIDERQPLLLRTGRAEQFQKMLPWSVLHPLLRSDRIGDGSLRVMRKFCDVPPQMYTSIDPVTLRRTVDEAALQSLCAQGMSFILNGIQKQVPIIAAFTAMLERHLCAAMSVNCYVSFGQDSAFGSHWDDHDELNIQIHGRKHWRFDGRRGPFPLKFGDFLKPLSLGEPESTFVLEPGDVLYCPRGLIHGADVREEQSVHLTFSHVTQRGYGALTWLAHKAIQEETFRRDINPFAPESEKKAQEESLREAMHRLVDTFDIEAFLVDRNLRREPDRPLSMGYAAPLSLTRWVSPSLRRMVALPGPEGGELVAGTVRVRLSAVERAVMAILLQRQCVQGQDLIAALDTVPSADVVAAISSLANKALVYLLDDN